MAYLTDRKRAEGLGSAKSGTAQHIRMMVTSVALLPLCVLFVFTFGSALGMGYEEAAVYYTRPFPALIAILTLSVGWIHFRHGAQVAIEDYTRGMTRKALILGTICLSYLALAASVLAIVRIAL
ncbi:succinate dehydrogenase, hydrophobic membrane anchor protein [Histidinibacterium aquaticum]|uniref:Succinate dehydrogenase, hydrophobic membrane anchor protein n=1 Tax=Histidinibacterium aquaticum TaxID=2613962 RepID=A0A5J5GAU0_9RHOB|nr:succinate dehydrogenase, hydrophobic membrane anchor protein [Histidinibacterium aquaticum]KAA9005227.1 succinate dehydrogenase, hydrophobic membrane anchor protein [Histidinibacterium aquaticum]